jgi:hypothetical protein
MEFVAKVLKPFKKKIELDFDGSIKSAHATWKSIIAQRDGHLVPIEEAIEFIDGIGRTYRTEQEKLRKAEEDRLNEIAHKEAERLQKLADKAKARGDQEKAESFEARAQETVSITPVVAPKVSKVEGIVIRKVWKFRIVDVNLIPRQYLIPNELMLGQMAKANKDTLKISGLEFFSEDSKL